MGVPAKDFEAVFAAGQLPGEVRDDDVKLGGYRPEVGGGEGEEGAHRLVGGIDEGVVVALVGVARGGVDGGLGGPVMSEGAVPLVIPAKAGTQAHDSIRLGKGGVPGSRLSPG